MMYAKEAPSLLDRYTLAKSFGFKGVECAFPYEFSKEDLIKVTNLRLWSFMVLTYLHYGLSMIRAAAGISNPGGLAVMWWA